MDEITITPRPTFDEYRRGIRVAPKPGRLSVVRGIVALLFGATMGFTIAGAWGTSVGTAAALAGACLIAILVLYRVTMNSRLRACYRAAIQDPVTYVFSRANIVGTCACSKAEYSWSAVERVCETPTTYTLVLRSLAVIMIPKRSIPAGRCEDFFSLLRAHAEPTRA